MLGAEFRQILPVLSKGGEADIENAVFKRISLWLNVKILHLTQYIRALTGIINFQTWVKRIGDGNGEPCPQVGLSAIKIPKELCIQINNEKATSASMFPNFQEL